MQLTNILRDIKEDAAMNRIYLPQEDLKKFGVSSNRILTIISMKISSELMKFPIGRARVFIKKANREFRCWKKIRVLRFLLASRIYAKILDEIEKQNYDVFSKRAHTSKAQKFIAIPKIWREAKKL